MSTVIQLSGLRTQKEESPQCGYLGSYPARTETAAGGYLEEPRTLGDYLIRKRRDLGLRQKDLATRVGATVQTLTNWDTTPPSSTSSLDTSLSGSREYLDRYTVLAESLNWPLLNKGPIIRARDDRQMVGPGRKCYSTSSKTFQATRMKRPGGSQAAAVGPMGLRNPVPRRGSQDQRSWSSSREGREPPTCTVGRFRRGWIRSQAASR